MTQTDTVIALKELNPSWSNRDLMRETGYSRATVRKATWVETSAKEHRKHLELKSFK